MLLRPNQPPRSVLECVLGRGTLGRVVFTEPPGQIIRMAGVELASVALQDVDVKGQTPRVGLEPTT